MSACVTAASPSPWLPGTGRGNGLGRPGIIAGQTAAAESPWSLGETTAAGGHREPTAGVDLGDLTRRNGGGAPGWHTFIPGWG